MLIYLHKYVLFVSDRAQIQKFKFWQSNEQWPLGHLLAVILMTIISSVAYKLSVTLGRFQKYTNKEAFEKCTKLLMWLIRYKACIIQLFV